MINFIRKHLPNILPENAKELTVVEWNCDKEADEVRKNCFITCKNGLIRSYVQYHKHPTGELVATTVYNCVYGLWFYTRPKHYIKN